MAKGKKSGKFVGAAAPKEYSQVSLSQDGKKKGEPGIATKDKK